MKTIKIILLSVAFTLNLFCDEYNVEFFHGFVYNMKEDLVIHQNAQENIVIKNADLKTKPQVAPPYYGIRISKWDVSNEALEFEFVHQKLYLDDLPADVQKFEITDGFNFLFLNKAFKDKKLNLVYRFGGGMAVSHPDITVRGKSNLKRGDTLLTIGKGYYFLGVVLQSSVEKIFYITPKLYFMTELKATYAKTKIPIAEGDVTLQNRALHLDFGLGYSF